MHEFCKGPETGTGWLLCAVKSNDCQVEGFFQQFVKVPVDPDRCEKVFVYHNTFKYQYFLKPKLKGTRCLADPVERCDAKKGDNVWNYARAMWGKVCKSSLCRWAKTGNWVNTFKSSEAAISKPWPQTMPMFSLDRGYEQAFKQLCIFDPNSKQFNGLLDFEGFFQEFDLKTPANTFNKTTCGCRSEDDCS